MRGAGLLCAALLLAPARAAADWVHAISADGLRSASSFGSASWRDTEVAAQLSLRCRPGSDGTIAWQLALATPERLAGFDIDAFEGPDAAGNGRRLSQLVLEGGLLGARIVATQSGWYDESRFVFEVAALAWTASDPALIADAIGPGTMALRWSVSAVDPAKGELQSRFDTTGAAGAIAATMLGCGPPPAPTAAELGAWRGRNPAASGLFESRTVRWHLAALLGPAEAAIRAHFARAEPALIDDAVLVVLAPGTSERSGAAFLLASDARAEVLLIDEGQVVRHTDAARAIDPPASVRAFVERLRTD